MELEEPLAYALATWARFDEAVTDELLRAVCGAFVLVATADGGVSDIELTRFLDVIRGRADAFPHLDLEAVERQFRDLSMAVLTDPEGGRQQALAAIALVKERPRQRELVQSAAQIALVADRRVERREEAVMGEICKALGMEDRSAPGQVKSL
jgi:tellurite resistance protein